MTGHSGFDRVSDVRLATFLFFAIPLIEMVILIKVGGAIGPLATVGLVVFTAVCGVWLLRLEGMATLFRVQEKLNRGELPETELLEGIMLLIGGVLLLTPGFATDAAGFVCLLPGLRRPLARYIIRTSAFSQFKMHTRFNRGQTGPGGGHVIDGEYVQESETQTRQTLGPENKAPENKAPENKRPENKQQVDVDPVTGNKKHGSE